MKVLIMGLGLHGGGYESAVYFLKRGACLTVTDLRDEQTLAPTIERLEAACKEFSCSSPIRYVLGRHELEDFKNADIVIKNPGVNPDSIYLQAAKKIETDISIFLAASPAQLYAVTGTKGKSTASSALYWILSKIRKSGIARLGGNITISPLSFLDELTEDDDVVLELSSFQLGDLRGRLAPDGSPLLKPKAAVITTILRDHLDRYGTMERYVNDKRVIYQGQDSGGITVVKDDDWGDSFRRESPARPLIHAGSPLEKGVSGGWVLDKGPGVARLYSGEKGFRGLCRGGETVELVPAKLLTPGDHQKRNLLTAALAVYGFGADADDICKALATFAGVEHRLEFFHETENIRFYNDSAATIPEAAAAAIDALDDGVRNLVLVTGGTDKNLDFSLLAKAAKKASAVILLAGTGSEKLAACLRDAGITYNGPFDDIDQAVSSALNAADAGSNVILSPGCASFGMFKNEFDRGHKWKEAVRRLACK